jgi:hypothetical protein
LEDTGIAFDALGKHAAPQGIQFPVQSPSIDAQTDPGSIAAAPARVNPDQHGISHSTKLYQALQPAGINADSMGYGLNHPVIQQSGTLDANIDDTCPESRRMDRRIRTGCQ